MMTALSAIIAVAVLGLWTFHWVGSILDARQARKELNERIAQLDEVVHEMSTTQGRRARQLTDRRRPLVRLLAAVRDEPTVPLR